MEKLRILQILPMYHPDGEFILNEHADVVKFINFNEQEIINYLSTNRVDGIILRAPAKITPEILEHCYNVKGISGAGVGLDNIDVEFATQKGIPILHAPKINTQATAEHAVSLLLAVVKQITNFDKETRNGNFNYRNGKYTMELQGKNLGLVGFGAIAQKTAKILVHGFEMKALAYVRSITEEKEQIAKQIGVKLTTSLEKVFCKSDVISLHLPFNKETDKLINSSLFSLMKSTAILINTARGGIINEGDLANALRENLFQGAGIDVYSTEPPIPNHPFFDFEQVVLSPHIAGLSLEAARKSSIIVAENLIRFLNGEEVPVIANRKALKDRR
jgi:D-3-phosphoglycerate dehydrogenase / 2-oxoglutarate reductase